MSRRVAQGRTHLVVGDAHFNPDHPGLERADWLGRVIVDLRPDVVVQVGDWWSLDSLNRFSPPGSISKEGARLADDLDIGREALGRVKAQLDEANFGVRKQNRIAPEMHLCLGNHEERLLLALEDSPSKLMGFLDEGSFRAAQFGWLQHSFLEPVRIDGITYSHYFDRLGKAPALNSKYIAGGCLAQQHRSVVFGHTHRLAYALEPAGDHRIQALNAGCYFEHREEYAKSANLSLWWRGLCVLRGVKRGTFDLETISIERIRERYG